MTTENDLGHAYETDAELGTRVQAGAVSLSYEDRILRRRRLTTTAGQSFVADLANTTNLVAGAVFILEDGRAVVVEPAEEHLLEVWGHHLPRLAWHIGNRHTPCEIGTDRLWIKEDHVLQAMLEQLGATVKKVERPFKPEGGAYGHGRTYGHAHGDEHDHDHETHSHSHSHS